MLSTGSEWDFEKLQAFDHAIAAKAKTHGLDTYPNQIEVISSEQMLDAYASSGLPITYPHWSYGKDFVINQQQYQKGQVNLAYEIVINSSPCIAYLMEENTLPMQALVIAHACYGHNAFFKGNYVFRQFTDAEGILDYLVFARHYIMACEQRYGYEAVSTMLDACHAIQHYGVDRYKSKKRNLSLEAVASQVRQREERNAMLYSDLQSTLPLAQKAKNAREESRYLEQPEENLLYFIEKHSPTLAPWQREIVRITRMLAQYFYPQMHTKVMNEGFATFWHYQLLYDLYDSKQVNDGFMLEFLQSHTNVVRQPSYQQSGALNPYALGFSMYRDIRRICEHPTAEDREWFPQIAGKDWRECIDFAMRNFKDDSFIEQYLSPTLMRKLRLFTVHVDSNAKEYLIGSIHDNDGYAQLRRNLARQYDRERSIPSIMVYDYRQMGDRALVLRHYRQHGRTLDSTSAKEVMAHIRYLWGFSVVLENVDEQGGNVVTWSIP